MFSAQASDLSLHSLTDQVFLAQAHRTGTLRATGLVMYTYLHTVYEFKYVLLTGTATSRSRVSCSFTAFELRLYLQYQPPFSLPYISLLYIYFRADY